MLRRENFSTNFVEEKSLISDFETKYNKNERKYALSFTFPQETAHTSLCHPTQACQVFACVCVCGVCIYWVCESEREVYLCLLKGVRESTASHLTSLCSRFVRASACRAVFVCVCVCVWMHMCMSMTEGRREAAKCVCVTDRTRQLRVTEVHSFLQWDSSLEGALALASQWQWVWKPGNTGNW